MRDDNFQPVTLDEAIDRGFPTLRECVLNQARDGMPEWWSIVPSFLYVITGRDEHAALASAPLVDEIATLDVPFEWLELLERLRDELDRLDALDAGPLDPADEEPEVEPDADTPPLTSCLIAGTPEDLNLLSQFTRRRMNEENEKDEPDFQRAQRDIVRAAQSLGLRITRHDDSGAANTSAVVHQRGRSSGRSRRLGARSARSPGRSSGDDDPHEHVLDLRELIRSLVGKRRL